MDGPDKNLRYDNWSITDLFIAPFTQRFLSKISKWMPPHKK
jgi:hypothetical protein